MNHVKKSFPYDQKKKFHLNDNPKLKSGDKPGKIAPIYEELGKNLLQFGTFHKKLSIGESMIPYYGHHTCKMFIKGKHIRFGFKIWRLCSSSGYLFAMEIYSGRKNESSGMHLGEDVVTQLLSKIADPSRHEIYFDNFFTSYNLLKKLADSRIRATDTVRSNRIRQCPLLDNNTLVKKTRRAMDYCTDGTVFICNNNSLE
ncbi:chimeric ERCC6-PGBD3 protein [Nephila pilipes]|uniref:Chimeric ERCC6-PGBD3 protein n=1 Tax=Nephila pilipes TaxID=299642 RepID=A0A8X6QA23_NEPPI|nr:chimeric ERCC6-PGBD3 protein [Nephila pilipes]